MSAAVRRGPRTAGSWYGPSPMRTVPLDEGPQDRRRIGPFWVEEGLGLVVVGALILALATILYVLALIHRPG